MLFSIIIFRFRRKVNFDPLAENAGGDQLSSACTNVYVLDTSM